MLLIRMLQILYVCACSTLGSLSAQVSMLDGRRKAWLGRLMIWTDGTGSCQRYRLVQVLVPVAAPLQVLC